MRTNRLTMRWLSVGIFCLLQVTLLSAAEPEGAWGYDESFDNTVTPLCAPEEELCRVSLRARRLETNTVINFGEFTSTPLVSVNGTLYKRDRSMVAECDALQDLEDGELMKVTAADGRWKMGFFINEQIPGPTITVYEGQTLRVRVRNYLFAEGIGVHWHGMKQLNSNYMDGVGALTQCNINPNEAFTYEFTASPAGTHWYHAHGEGIRQDGMYGALIVLPRPPVYQIDVVLPPIPQIESYPSWYREAGAQQGNLDLPEFAEEYVLLLADWFKEPSTDWLLKYVQTGEKFADGYDNFDSCLIKPPGSRLDLQSNAKWESGLINGRGRHPDASLRPPLSRFKLKQGNYYRFRIINAAAVFGFKISFQGHPLTVINSDGYDVVPKMADSMYVYNGERYDVYIHANQDIDNYWILVETADEYTPLDDMFGLRHGYMEAVLEYEGAGRMEPRLPKRLFNCDEEQPCVAANCQDASSPEFYEDSVICEDLIVMENANTVNLERSPPNLIELFLNFHFPTSVWNTHRSSVNGHNFELPSVPPVLPGNATNIYRCKNDTACKYELGDECMCTYIIKVPLGAEVQMVLINSLATDPAKPGSLPHPVHLHGYHFYVVGEGSILPSDDGTPVPLTCTDPQCAEVVWTDPTWQGGNVPGLNLHNPVKKDTVTIPGNSYYVVRFTADNPGYWMFHCHMDIHFADGMAGVLQVGEDHEIPTPPPNFPTCGNFNANEGDELYHFSDIG